MINRILSLMLLIFFFSCSSEEGAEVIPVIDGKIETQKLNNGIATFGWKLFHKQLEATDKNVLVSPLSVHTALSMTLQGADNNTRDEMLATLECSDITKEDIAVTYKELETALYKKKDFSELGGKNAIFYDDKRMTPVGDFLSVNNYYFNTQTSNLDFSKPASKDNINQWADDATKGKIKEILTEIKDEDVMFLINALYFKGDWEIGFDEELTKEATFKKSNNTVQNMPFMYSDDNRPYFTNNELSAVDMTIKGSEYAMTLILPKDDSKSYLLGKSNGALAAWYDQIVDGMKESRIEVKLPKFEVKTKETLNNILQKMGMLDAFTGAADLSKLGSSSLGKLFISRVLHDAYIKVDEKGVEGAAVTTVGVSVTSLPPQLNLNRSFIYVIRHNESGIPVFIGLFNGVD